MGDKYIHTAYFYPNNSKGQDEEIKFEFTSNTLDKDKATEQAIKKVSLRGIIDKYALRKKYWSLGTIVTDFNNPPWDTTKELKNVILDIDYTKTCKLVPGNQMFVETHRSRKKQVTSNIESYYSGLDPDPNYKQNLIVIKTSPTWM